MVEACIWNQLDCWLMSILEAMSFVNEAIVFVFACNENEVFDVWDSLQWSVGNWCAKGWNRMVLGVQLTFGIDLAWNDFDYEGLKDCWFWIECHLYSIDDR